MTGVATAYWVSKSVVILNKHLVGRYCNDDTFIGNNHKRAKSVIAMCNIINATIEPLKGLVPWQQFCEYLQTEIGKELGQPYEIDKSMGEELQKSGRSSFGDIAIVSCYSTFDTFA